MVSACILAWHADHMHKVSLEFVTTLWKFDTALDEEAVVLMNANVPDKSNHRGLEAGLKLWKHHANTVVALQGWKVIKQQQQQDDGLTPIFSQKI